MKKAYCGGSSAVYDNRRDTQGADSVCARTPMPKGGRAFERGAQLVRSSASSHDMAGLELQGLESSC